MRLVLVARLQIGFGRPINVLPCCGEAPSTHRTVPRVFDLVPLQNAAHVTTDWIETMFTSVFVTTVGFTNDNPMTTPSEFCRRGEFSNPSTDDQNFGRLIGCQVVAWRLGTGNASCQLGRKFVSKFRVDFRPLSRLDKTEFRLICHAWRTPSKISCPVSRLYLVTFDLRFDLAQNMTGDSALFILGIDSEQPDLIVCLFPVFAASASVPVSSPPETGPTPPRGSPRTPPAPSSLPPVRENPRRSSDAGRCPHCRPCAPQRAAPVAS